MHLHRLFAPMLWILCGSSLFTQTTPPSWAPTFTKDIAPILQTHCQGCHRAGEPAPFSLLPYHQARPSSKATKEPELARKMPPCFPAPPSPPLSPPTPLPPP